MKKIFLKSLFYLIFGFLINDCIAQKNDSLVFVNSLHSIIFYDNNSFLIKRNWRDINPLLYCGDEILSFGTYVKKWNNYYLFSDSSIMSDKLNIIPLCEIEKENLDFTIILNSPYFDFIKQNPKFAQSYFSLIKITEKTQNFENEVVYPTIFFNDTIVLKNYSKKEISKIRIEIYPLDNLRIPWYNFLSLEYTLSKKGLNYISIYIPQFSLNYIYYKRYEDLPIIQLNKNTIKFKNLKYYKDFNKRFIDSKRD
jgi:hypothetical protein